MANGGVAGCGDGDDGDGDAHSTKNVILVSDIRKSRTGKRAIVGLPQMGYAVCDGLFKKKNYRIWRSPRCELPQMVEPPSATAKSCLLHIALLAIFGY